MAAGDLPRRDAARAPGRWGRRCVRARGLRPCGPVPGRCGSSRAAPGAVVRDRRSWVSGAGRRDGDDPGCRAVVGGGAAVVRRRGARPPGRRVALRIGFRTVAIVDGVLTVNGRRVLFHGVNRHEHDPVLRSRRTGRAAAAGPAGDEAAQHQRDPDQPLPAGLAAAGAVRRARVLGDGRVRLRDARVLPAGLARESGRRSATSGRVGGPDAPDGGAGQEPPVRDHVVARQRGRDRAGTSAMAEWTRRAGSVAAGALRGGSELCGRRCVQPDVRRTRRRSRRSGSGPRSRSTILCWTRGGGRCRSCSASIRMPGATVLVGMRGVRRAVPPVRALPGRLPLGVDGTRHPAARTAPTRTAATSAKNSTTATYVLDGLVFPDLTPQPVLLEVRKAFEPIHLTAVWRRPPHHQQVRRPGHRTTCHSSGN